MTPKVERTDKGAGWPANQWHPAYASIQDWLDNEAPEPAKSKTRNGGKWATPAADTTPAATE